MKCATSQRLQNLSLYEQLMKLHSILLYGKATLEDKLPGQALVNCFMGMTNGAKQDQATQQHITLMLQSVGIPLAGHLKTEDLSEEKFFDLFCMLMPKNDIEQILHSIVKTKRYLQFTGDQFENFLNHEQRHPGLNELLHPFYNKQKTAALIQKMERDEQYSNKSKLKHGACTK
jgi:hypothetical protein